MGRWSGETQTMQVGTKWTYKIKIEQQTETGTRSNLVLGLKVFDTEEGARAAGDVHLKAELVKRSGGTSSAQ